MKNPKNSYKPAFIKSVLKSAKNKPIMKFKNAKDFLNQIKET